MVSPQNVRTHLFYEKVRSCLGRGGQFHISLVASPASKKRSAQVTQTPANVVMEFNLTRTNGDTEAGTAVTHLASMIKAKKLLRAIASDAENWERIGVKVARSSEATLNVKLDKFRDQRTTPRMRNDFQELVRSFSRRRPNATPAEIEGHKTQLRRGFSAIYREQMDPRLLPRKRPRER